MVGVARRDPEGAESAEQGGRGGRALRPGQLNDQGAGLAVGAHDRALGTGRELVVAGRLWAAPRRALLAQRTGGGDPVGQSLVHPHRDQRPRQPRGRTVAQLVGERLDLEGVVEPAQLPVLDEDPRGGRLPAIVTELAVQHERHELVEVDGRLQQHAELVDRPGQHQRDPVRPRFVPQAVEVVGRLLGDRRQGRGPGGLGWMGQHEEVPRAGDEHGTELPDHARGLEAELLHVGVAPHVPPAGPLDERQPQRVDRVAVVVVGQAVPLAGLGQVDGRAPVTARQARGQVAAVLRADLELVRRQRDGAPAVERARLAAQERGGRLGVDGGHEAGPVAGPDGRGAGVEDLLGGGEGRRLGRPGNPASRTLHATPRDCGGGGDEHDDVDGHHRRLLAGSGHERLRPRQPAPS